MKIKKYLFIFSVVCLGVALGMSPCFAQTQEQAMASVNRMAELLSQTKSLSVTVDAGFEAVQDSGQKIEFGETRRIALERPAHLRIDETKRNGEMSQLIFDGKDISLYTAKENVYAVDPNPGTVDEMIRHFVHDLDMRLPLAEMLSTELPKTLAGKVREADFVEESSIAGVSCDHVALRGDEIDLQVWVEKGEQPLPRRIVITYKKVDGQPQFWAEFRDWNLAPDFSESEFAFVAPEKAAKIIFSPQQVTRIGEIAAQGGK